MNKDKMLKYYKKLEILLKDMNKDHVSESSAQCAYYTILSFIPFVILVITLIQYTGIKSEALLDVISTIIPENMNQMVVGIVREAFSKSIGTISISILFVIWCAGRGLFALTMGLHTIYHTEDDNKITSSYAYLRLRSLWQTIIFIFIIGIGLIAMVFGKSLKDIVLSKFQIIEKYPIITTMITDTALLVITFIIFLIVYRFIGKRNISLKNQIYGAIFGAITLNIISFIFSRYLYIFKGFSLMYGSLTTLMLIMMWTYSCFYTIFLGAEINKWLEKLKKEKLKEEK